MAMYTAVPVLQGLVLLFWLIALPLPFWSTTTVSEDLNPTAKGDVNVGLWEVCADLDGFDVFTPLNNDCRVGHCTSTGLFASARSSQWTGNGLCDKSKASGAFGMFSALCAIAVLWATVVRRKVFQADEARGWAMFFLFWECIFSIISFAVWISWQEEMNSSDSRTDPRNEVIFAKLETGPGCALAITCFALTLICFLVGYCDRKFNTAAPVPPSRTPAQNPVYDMQMEEGPGSPA